jgi:methionyl aminopeptidase
MLKPRADRAIVIKTPQELKIMREAGKVVNKIAREVVASIEAGMTTREIDSIAVKCFKKYGMRSTAHGYFGFPGHICVSVNNQVVHGIPGSLKVQAGDLVKMDIAGRYKGYVGDTAVTMCVGGQPTEDQARLMQVTREALYAGIAQARPGNRLSDIGHAIQTHVEARGMSVVREFVGHGVGREMHEAPQVSHWGPPGKGPTLRPGIVIAIEPQVNIGSREVIMLDDGWTAITADGSLSAHMEHTVAITPDGPWILTEP